MKNFEFKLEKVLKIRDLREKKALQEFLEAREAYERARNRLEEMNHNRQKIYVFLRKEENPEPEKIIQIRNYLEIQRGNIEKQEERVKVKIDNLQECQQELLLKRKNRQVLEKLREKEFDNFRKEFLLKQQKELDEIGIKKYGG